MRMKGNKFADMGREWAGAQLWSKRWGYQIFSPSGLYLLGCDNVQPQHEMADPIMKLWSLYTMLFYMESSAAHVSFPYSPYIRQ